MELRKYWNIIWKRKWIIVYTTIFMIACVFVLFVFTPRMYKSKAKIAFKGSTTEQLMIKNLSNMLGQMGFTDPDNAMGTVEELIESSPVVGKAIQDLNLKDGKGRFLNGDSFFNPFIVKLFMKGSGVDIQNLEMSDAFKIVGYSHDPAVAEKIADEVVKNFLSELAKRYRNEITEARQVLEEKVPVYKARLEEAEKKIADFKSTHLLYNASSQSDTLFSKMESLKTSKDQALSLLEQAKASLKDMKEPSWLNQKDFKDILVNIERDNVVENYKEQLLTFETALAKLKVDLTEEHPDVKAVKKDIELTKDKIKEQITKSFASQILGNPALFDNLANSYSNRLISVVEQTVNVKLFEGQIEKTERELREIQDQTQEFDKLNLEVSNFTALYNSTFSDLEYAKTAEKLDLRNAVECQPAQKATAYFPPEAGDLYLYMVVVLIMGIIAGVFFAFVIDYIDHTIKTPEEIRKLFKEELLGIFPRVRWLKKTVETRRRSPFTQPVHNLWANIRILKGEEPKVISIISPARRDGRSTIVSHMAYVLGQNDKKVVLIDGDLRRPSVHKIFQLPPSEGLTDYLSGTMSIEEITAKTSLPHLDIIPAGSLSLSDPQKYLQSDKFLQLIKKLKERYDLVIFDTPAFLSGADSLILSTLTERVLLVLREKRNPKSKVIEIIERLKKANVEITGILFNDVRL